MTFNLILPVIVRKLLTKYRRKILKKLRIFAVESIHKFLLSGIKWQGGHGHNTLSTYSFFLYLFFYK